MAPLPKITIREVAQRAGVSISTVSHTFSGVRPISEPTRQRVLRAADDLGYDPNPSARSLRTGRTGMVGLLLRPGKALTGGPDLAETFNRLLGSLTTEMLRRRSAVVYVPDLEDPLIGGVPMDACIVAHPYRHDDAVTTLLRRATPVVLIDSDPGADLVPWLVRLDYHAAMTALLDHLHAQGAAAITLVSGAEENAWNLECRSAYSSWCEWWGLARRIRVVQEDLTSEEVAQLGRALLSGPNRPDALVVAPSDYAAVIASVAEADGVRVPDDLLIATLIDTEHSRRSAPPLTALDLRHEELAAGAVDLVFRLLAGQDPPAAPIVLEPRLLLRASSQRTE